MQIFTIYSKPACPFCDQAKALLTAKNIQFEVINLDIGQSKVDGEVYIARDELLALIPSARTMPQITKQDDCSSMYIGGFAELKRHLHA